MSTTKETSTVETEAMRTFGGKDLLVERPDGMDFDVYRMLLKEQSSRIKKMFTSKPSRRIANLMR